MPNWCCANWFLKGPKEKIQSFADTVNSLPNKKPVDENDFGCFWLVNLACALGVVDKDNYDTVHVGNLRGIIDPNPHACATLAAPNPDSDKKIDVIDLPDGKAVIYFSTISALDMPNWMPEYFKEKMPDCKYGYKATDEFGNFHKRTANYVDEIYEAGGMSLDCWDYFDEGEEKEFLETIAKAVDLGDIDELLKKPDWYKIVQKKVEDFNDENENNEVVAIIYTC